MTAETEASTAGKRVLLVEDEALICLLIEAILVGAGYEVVVANSVPAALAAIDQEAPDAAVLDLNLKGKKVYPVAERLAEAGIHFVFATGGGAQDIQGFPDRPCVGKPFQEAELLTAVARLLA